MKKLLIVTLGAAIAATSFAPVAQAKHRMKKAMAPAPMAMAPMMNPRVAPNGDFYATPVGAGEPMAGMGMMMAPLAIPGAVVGGAMQPLM